MFNGFSLNYFSRQTIKYVLLFRCRVISSNANNFTISSQKMLFESNESLTNNTGLETTSGSVVQSSFSLQHYCQCVLVALGCAGTLANGCVLLAMKQIKWKLANVLMMNQLILDCFSCFAIVVTYAVDASSLYLQGVWGFWVCVIIDGSKICRPVQLRDHCMLHVKVVLRSPDVRQCNLTCFTTVARGCAS